MARLSFVSLCSLLLLLSLPLSSVSQPTSPPPAGAQVPATVVTSSPPSKPLVARAPQNSRRMGKRAKDQTVIKSVRKDYSSFLCPDASVACPVKAGIKEDELATLADWFKIGFECLEVKKEVKSCGGCVTLGAGQDCTLIPNSLVTSCDLGQCGVTSCKPGYVLGRDNKSCVRKNARQPPPPTVGYDANRRR